MSRATYVVLGDVMTDVVCLLRGPVVVGSDSPAAIRVQGGGSAANTAAWLAATGHRAVLVCRVGDDPAGEVSVATLRRSGVEVAATVDPERATGTCVVLVGPDGERSMVPDTGANAVWALGDLPDEGWGSATHLHVSGYALVNPGARDAALEAIRRTRAGGGTVSVDVASAEPLRENGPARFLGGVAGVDVLLANEAEAAVLTGRADPEEAGRSLAAYAGVAVVKLGAHGALLARRTGAIVRRPGRPVEVIDTTGAGDAFAAGFLPAWRDGLGDEASLSAGNALGADAVARPGARPSRRV